MAVCSRRMSNENSHKFDSTLLTVDSNADFSTGHVVRRKSQNCSKKLSYHSKENVNQVIRNQHQSSDLDSRTSFILSENGSRNRSNLFPSDETQNPGFLTSSNANFKKIALFDGLNPNPATRQRFRPDSQYLLDQPRTTKQSSQISLIDWDKFIRLPSSALRNSRKCIKISSLGNHKFSIPLEPTPSKDESGIVLESNVVSEQPEKFDQNTRPMKGLFEPSSPTFLKKDLNLCPLNNVHPSSIKLSENHESFYSSHCHLENDLNPKENSCDVDSFTSSPISSSFHSSTPKHDGFVFDFRDNKYQFGECVSGALMLEKSSYSENPISSNYSSINFFDSSSNHKGFHNSSSVASKCSSTTVAACNSSFSSHSGESSLMSNDASSPLSVEESSYLPFTDESSLLSADSGQKVTAKYIKSRTSSSSSILSKWTANRSHNSSLSTVQCHLAAQLTGTISKSITPDVGFPITLTDSPTSSELSHSSNEELSPIEHLTLSTVFALENNLESRYHTSSIHSFLKCLHCDVSTSNARDMSSHVRYCHIENVDKVIESCLRCPGCSSSAVAFESSIMLLRHLPSCHEKRISSNSLLSSKEQKCRSYWPTPLSTLGTSFGCFVCGLLFASESRLDLHHNDAHQYRFSKI